MADLSKHIIPEIYSDVMFQLAEDSGLSDRVLEDLKSIAALLDEESEFVSILITTKLSDNEKVQAVRRVFAGRVCPLTLDFLSVLARRNRLGFLGGISDRYEVSLNERKNTKRVAVTVARKMDDRQLEKLKNDLRQAIRSEIQLELNINPDIIGGIIIRRGDTVVDNSVRTILDRAVQAVVRRSMQKSQSPPEYKET